MEVMKDQVVVGSLEHSASLFFLLEERAFSEFGSL